MAALQESPQHPVEGERLFHLHEMAGPFNQLHLTQARDPRGHQGQGIVTNHLQHHVLGTRNK